MRYFFALLLTACSAFGQYGRVLYNVNDYSIFPTNIITSATFLQSSWLLQPAAAYLNATNFVADLTVSESLLTVTDAVRFTHSTNRPANNATNRFSSFIIKNSSGSSKTLAFNAGWRFLTSEPTSIDDAAIARLDVIGYGPAESDVIAFYNLEGGVVGGAGAWDPMSTNALTAKLESNVWQNAWGGLATNALTGKLGSNAALGDWMLYSTNVIRDTATNTIKFLTNIWGDVGRGFASLTDGQVLKYHAASGTWTNLADVTGGGSFNTNASQFGPSVTLSIKTGAMQTNGVFYSDTTNSIPLLISNQPGQFNHAFAVMSTNDQTVVFGVEADGHAVFTNTTRNVDSITTNSIEFGSFNIAGFGHPVWWHGVSNMMLIEPAVWSSRKHGFHPEVGTRIGPFRIGTTTNVGCTVSHPGVTAPELLPDMFQVASGAGSNASASAFTDRATLQAGNQAGRNGYFFVSEFATTNGIIHFGGGGLGLFVGLTDAATTVHTNMATTTNLASTRYVGFATHGQLGAGATNLHVVWKDNAGGNETRVDSTLPLLASNLYRGYLYCPPLGRTIGWRLENLTTGHSSNSYITATIPTNQMRFGGAIANRTNIVHSLRMSYSYGYQAPGK
jgi:hypothetical protein